MPAAVPTTTVDVIVTSCHDVKTQQALKITSWGEGQRLGRAWRRLAMWWGAALFAAIIPPHIPWLLLLLSIGPIAATRAMRQKSLIHRQTVTCPDCGHACEIEEQAESWPLGARCSPCQSVVWMEPTSTPAAGQG